MSALERLTAVLADSRRYDDPFVKPSIDDLALVLAVVEAAQAYVDECAGLDDAARVIRTFDALLAALAAIEGAKP